jgi:hypothetical protein
MSRKIIYTSTYFLLLLVTTSCSRNFCKASFYIIYQTQFQSSELDDDFVKTDLRFKYEIFSSLCIPDNIDKMLIVEYQNATEAWYSRGLIYTYDDSKTYYFKIMNGKAVAGKGSGGNTDLVNILRETKESFNEEKIKLSTNYGNIYDAPTVNILLYDSLQAGRFNSFNFPIVVWDRFHS